MSRFAGACRFFVAVTVALVAAGCGGSSSTTTTPPPTNTTPASVVVQAGDGQQAAPGAAVATSPAVLVTNSAGQPIAGVTVTFTVDSGGGSLSTTTATTGANGIATAGTWTLGSSEGRNTLRVTVGSLPPVKIAATAVVAATSYPPVTIGTGGGSITVTQPGPLNGFSITVPAGAFSTGITAAASYASNTTVLPRIAVNPIGPVIRISTTTTAYGAKPLTVHIPVAVPANTFPVIRMYDPVTGANESMAPVSWDANGVTGLTGHLNSANFLVLPGGNIRTSLASLTDPGVTIIVDAVPTALLGQDYDTGFRPGVDDWEFGLTPVEGPNIPASAMGPTSLWYFLTRQGPQKLNGRFAQATAVPLSDRSGLRWITVLDQEFKTDLVNAIGAAIGGNHSAGSDQNQFNLIRANFVRDVQAGLPPRPQLVTLSNSSGVPLSVVAYRVHGTQLSIYNPAAPGDASQYLDFPAGSVMTPLRVPIFTLPNFDGPLASGATLFLPISQLPTTYAQVLNGSIGQALFPTYELHGWAGRLYDTLFLVDTLRWWVECAQCRNGFATTLSPAPSNNVTSGLLYALNPTTLSGTFNPNGFLSATSPSAGNDRTLGMVLYSAANAQQVYTSGGSCACLWLDWHAFTLRRLQTSIAPAVPVQTPGTPLSLTFQVAQNLLPPHVKYVWDFGDQQPAVTVTVVDTPTVQHTYAALGSYPITAKIIDVRNNQVIGKATTAAAITEKWSLVTFQQVSLTGDPAYPPASNESRTMSELRDSILARPAGTTLQLFHGGVALPQGLHELGDFLVRADVNVTAPSMFLSFPRGQPAGGLLAEAVAATGAASSAALVTSPCHLGCYPVVFTNAITLGGTPGALTYAGKAANWVGPMPNTRPCNVVGPTSDPRGKSPVTGYLELNATQGSGGMQGTITFVTPVVNQAGASTCVWDTVTEIRRTFAFTAVPAP